MIGTILAHYRITGELGAGGMGEVWRATDEKLGREVALKVLSEEFAENAERLDRFEREARAVAALNHPHIVTIFSVEESEGIRFLTMELIEGQSLDKMIPEGGLDLETFFELATPLAEAVSAAHDKSVIHRDLKPSNVMVDGNGRVKVLDFGLAKLQESGEVSESSELPTEALTGVGMIVGTMPYMSPEQIEGKIVDHRTDIFSLGVLLYEMSTGSRPFRGDSQPALMSSILRDAPHSVVEFRDDLPRHLGRVITRCLEKDRRDRYQTARDVFNELRALERETSGVSTAHRSSIPVRRRPLPVSSRVGSSRAIAVAPFRSSSKSEELETLAEGLSEDIAAGLARFPYLTILDGTELSSSDSSTSVVAGQGARYVLRGGLRSAGAELRLSVQLVEVETGAHVWSETYDRRLEGAGIFELQDSLTDRIVATVGDYSGVMARLVAAELRAMDDDEMTVDDWIMRAVCFVQVIHPPEEHAAIRDGLEKMVEMHPDNAEAHAWLANTYVNEFAFGFNPLEDPIGRSLRAAQRAVDLDPTTQAGWLNLAGGHFFHGDLAAFEAAATRAMALNPRNSYAIAYMGLCLGNSGQRDRGAQLGTRACALNPHHPEWYPFVNFYHLYECEEYEEACSVIKGMNWPKFPYTHINFAAACGQLGRPDEARNSIETLRDTFGFDLEAVRKEFLKWGHTEDFVEHILDGLRKAGLEDGEESTRASTVQAPSQPEAVRPRANGKFDLKSIAVLPFLNMSEEKANEFFSDGVTEEILTSLSKIEGLRVISRTSAMAYKGTSRSIREIAAELGVGSVLEGSVRRAANRVRVTAQLVEAATDEHLWSESYDRDLEDIFEVQSDVAVQIAQALQTELASNVVAQIQKRPTDNMKAYDLYLKGRQESRTLRAPEILRGIGRLEEAISLDADFALAHAELGLALLRSAYWGSARGRQDFEEARQAADRALELDQSNAVAWVVRAGVRCLNELDWDGAVDDYHEAIRLDPNEVEAHHWLGMTLFLMGRFDEAVAAQEAALALDPQSPNVISHLGLALCLCGRIEEGERMLVEGFEQHPVFFDFPNMLGIALKQQGRFAEAARWYERACELSGRHPIFEAGRASTLRLAGAVAEAEEIVRALLDNLDDSRVDSIGRALTAVANGDVDAAVRHFQAAADQRLPLVFWCLRAVANDREFPREDPGVQALRRRLWPQDSAFADLEDRSEVGRKAIAVLPFANHSAGPDQEWIAAGTHEALLTALQQIGGLRVTSRTSSMQYRETTLPLREIARELNVGWLVEGSVTRVGDRMRVAASLVDAATDQQVWANQYESDVRDILAQQNKVAREIAGEVQVAVTPEEDLRLARAQQVDPAAYRAYVRGLHHFDRVNPADFKRSIELFEEATSLDPKFAPAHAGLAAAYGIGVEFGWVSRAEAAPLAEHALRAVQRMDPGSASAYRALANVQFHIRRDLEAAEESYRRASELESNAYTLFEFGWLLSQCGRHAEAVAVLEEVVALDPRSPLFRCDLGWWSFGAQDYDRAIEEARFALEIDPTFAEAHWLLAVSYAEQERYEDALAELELYEVPSGYSVLWYRGHILALAGRRDAALKTLDELEQSGAPGTERAYVLLGLDDRAGVLEALEEAECSDIAFQPYLWPRYETYHDDPRFRAVLERFGLPLPPQGEAS